jgi:hypothetical protein
MGRTPKRLYVIHRVLFTHELNAPVCHVQGTCCCMSSAGGFSCMPSTGPIHLYVIDRAHALACHQLGSCSWMSSAGSAGCMFLYVIRWAHALAYHLLGACSGTASALGMSSTGGMCLHVVRWRFALARHPQGPCSCMSLTGPVLMHVIHSPPTLASHLQGSCNLTMTLLVHFFLHKCRRMSVSQSVSHGAHQCIELSNMPANNSSH